MNKYVIYTAIIGKYDKIVQPSAVDDRFDYVLFSDSIQEGRVGVWQVRRIDYYNPIQTKIARFVKTHPESLLGEYEASLWHDANISIRSSVVYDRFLELVGQNVKVASVEHHSWDCVYEELFRILDFRYESEKVVLDWGRFLRKRHFPKHAGLIETNLLFRIHSYEEVKRLDSIWWNYIEKCSRRDQLSFPIALLDSGLQCDLFLPKGMSVRNYEGTEFVKHKNESSKFDPTEKPAWLMHHYYKHNEEKENVANLYYWIYGRRNPRFWAMVLGQYYRVKDRLMK